MKTFNRILWILVIGYSLFTGFIGYQMIFKVPLSYGGEWKLVWNDEFNGSALDTTRWTPVSQGFLPNNELQAFIDENVTVQNGCLILTSKKEDWAGPDNFHPGQAATQHYTSGYVETKGKFAWTSGRFEIRAKLPYTQGLLSYGALFPTDDTWPPEIEIMEVKGNRPKTVWMCNFWGTTRHFQLDSSDSVSGLDYSDGFHIYTVEWEPQSLCWYIDEVKQFQTNQHIPSQPLYLNLRTVIGGNFAGNPDDKALPQQFVVDWVRVYQRK